LQPAGVTETISDGGNDGFYLKSARILGTDEQGQLLYEIEADFVEQQTSNEIAMQNVRISYAANSQVPWIINADAATISEDQSLLRLSGHVIAVSNEGFAGQVTEIRAPQLDIEPTTYKAETDSRVQIRIGSRSLTATGMLALLQDNRLQLRSNVNGKFVP
jgi:LPS export ABC transporter protein LptC